MKKKEKQVIYVGARNNLKTTDILTFYEIIKQIKNKDKENKK